MKVRKDFLLALFILFVIPVIGYFLLMRAEDDRMKISAGLQPKDSISLDFAINYLNAEGLPKSDRLVDMPYVIKVVATQDIVLDRGQLEHILYIINDRTDLAFLIYESPIRHTVKNRIPGYNYVTDTANLSAYGDILLADAFNRILQVYDRTEPELYKKLLEDISYALPMVDYRIEKMAEDANQK